MQNCPKNWHYSPHDKHTHVCMRGWEMLVFGKFGVRTKLMIPMMSKRLILFGCFPCEHQANLFICRPEYKLVNLYIWNLLGGYLDYIISITVLSVVMLLFCSKRNEMAATPLPSSSMIHYKLNWIVNVKAINKQTKRKLKAFDLKVHDSTKQQPFKIM